METLNETGNRCLQLIYAYHHHIDMGRATAGIDCFSGAAEFEAHDKIYTGHNEILEFLRNRKSQTDRSTVHVITGPRFSYLDDKKEIVVAAIAMINLRDDRGTYRCDRALDMVHRFRKFGDNWLIVSRRSIALT